MISLSPETLLKSVRNEKRTKGTEERRLEWTWGGWRSEGIGDDGDERNEEEKRERCFLKVRNWEDSKIRVMIMVVEEEEEEGVFK